MKQIYTYLGLLMFVLAFTFGGVLSFIRAFDPQTQRTYDILGFPAGNDFEFPLTLISYPIHTLINMLVFFGLIGIGYYLLKLSGKN